MCYQTLILLVIIYSVYSDDLSFVHLDHLRPVIKEPEYRSEKYIDIYTNDNDFKGVVNSYYGATRRPNNRRFERLPEILHDISVFKNVPYMEKISSKQLEDSTHLDRIDFHYPSTEVFPETSGELESNFGKFTNADSPNKNGYVFVQSQKITTNEDDLEEDKYEENQRPMFLTTNTYIQKIPKVTSTTTAGSVLENKYEEINMNKTETSSKAKQRINQILRRYLSKLYQRKYNTSSNNQQSSSRLEQEQKTKKYLNLWDLKNKTVKKLNKFFSLFTIVQFNNTQCTASNSAGSYQGTCYTTSQCSTEGGTAIGNCANGYGVCCIFSGTCGGSGSNNCTYFQSPNYPDYYPSDGDGGVVVPTTQPPTTNPSPTPDPRLPWNFNREDWGRQSDGATSCTFNVNKLNSNISKIRIDFEDLELTGPTNGTCTDERLIISGQNSNSQIPVICGYNTGQHVYVDVSSLSGSLQLSVLSSTGARKRFKIKICQFEDTCLEPSSNCLQYYTGVTGVISSFNYDQAAMFARSSPSYFNNLNYAICIRREEGYCSISYRNVVNGVEYPFQFTNRDDSGNIIIPPGQAGADIFNCPDDYIVIDGTRLCGDKFNDGSINDDFTMNADVTDTGAGPIVIPVRTDSMVTGLGFKLFYTQNRCGV